MKKVIKKLLNDWQVWVVLCCGLANIIFCICEKDWTEALWVLMASLLFLASKTQNMCVEAAIDYINEQDEMLSKASSIIKDQTDLIKELEDKLNGQN